MAFVRGLGGHPISTVGMVSLICLGFLSRFSCLKLTINQTFNFVSRMQFLERQLCLSHKMQVKNNFKILISDADVMSYDLARITHV